MALDRKMLREQIKDLVIERILDGTYQPGDRVVELQLMNELEVSQAPVREAIRELEALRFIESEPFRGARVRHVTAQDLAETYPVRAALEELAGQLAATRLTPEVEAALEAELDAMLVCAKEGNLHEQLSHDARFHELIVEAAQNRALLEAWRGLRIEARTLVSVIKSRTDVVEIAQMHRAILDALRTGSPEEAGKEMRRHIESFGATIEGDPS